MRYRKPLTAVAALVLGMAALLAPAGSATAATDTPAATTKPTTAGAKDLKSHVSQRPAQTGDNTSESDGPGTTAVPCPYYYFCAYPYQNFEGTPSMIKDCSKWMEITWAGYGSWINNQTPGTRARFFGSGTTLLYTTPGAYSSSASYNWLPIYHVDPC